MKYLVSYDLDPNDMPKLAKKAKEYDEDKKKFPDKYPEESFQLMS